MTLDNTLTAVLDRQTHAIVTRLARNALAACRDSDDLRRWRAAECRPWQQAGAMDAGTDARLADAVLARIGVA